jgi:hypothetical protein
MKFYLLIGGIMLFGIAIAATEKAGFNHSGLMQLGLIALFMSGVCIGAVLVTE